MTYEAIPCPKPLPEPSLAIVLAGVMTAVLIHSLNWPTHPFDFDEFLLPWYQHILDHGPLGAFAHPFSNYTPTYLYLLAAMSLTYPWIEPFDAIKIVAMVGTGLLGISLARLAEVAGVRARWLPLLAFLVPSAAINSSKLGQCDAFWVAACLLSVSFGLQKRLRTMLVMAGVALAFKAQAAFLAPFLFAILLRERASLHWWLIPATVYMLVMLPAALAGWPVFDLIGVYVRQSQELPHFISFAQQPWFLLRLWAPQDAYAFFSLGFAAAIGATMWIAFGLREKLDDAKGALLVALLSANLIPYLLPKMHERYWLLADMLALCLAMVVRTPATVSMAGLILSSSLLALIALTHSVTAAMVVATLLTSAALILNIWLLASAGRSVARQPLPT